MLDIPKCPDCGSSMILRTARRGHHRGDQFYGCTNYPRCKGIVNFNNTSENISPSGRKDSGSLIRTIKLPVFLQAREKFQDFQVRFYESLATPKDLLNRINSGEIERDSVQFFSKWRLDYPASNHLLSPQIKQIYVVASKILSRGRLTLVSPDLEEKLKNLFDINTEDFSYDFYKYLFLPIPQEQSHIWFDGRGTEKIFYEKFLPKILGPGYRKFVLTQVHFSSLVPADDSDYQRIDFLITTPEKCIVVELDGPEHDAHGDRDKKRDEMLKEAGYYVIRIRNEEIESNIGPNIQELIDSFKEDNVRSKEEINYADKYLLAIKLSHQLQISIIESLLSGTIDLSTKSNIYFDYESVIFNKREIEKISNAIEKDIRDLLVNLGKLYNVNINTENLYLNINLEKIETKNSIIISYNENLSSNIPRFIIQDISFDHPIAHYARPTQVETIKNPNKENLEYFLKYLFRHEHFLEGQFESVSRALEGKDAIVLLPTGSGKSIAFQLASLLLPGVSIVIDPILSLINDQIDNLERIGIDRAIGITSQITDPNLRSKVISAFGQGEYIFCYVAPERFQTEEFRNTIKDLTVSTPISLIVIDEAHCVSEWGHDFRTSYLNVGRVTRSNCRSNGRTPSLLALTGTASNAVLRDVQRELQIEDFDAIITPKTFDRKELKYSVFECTSEEKFNVMKGCLQRLIPEKFNMSNNSFYQPRGNNSMCGLIFCPWVGGDVGVVKNAQKVSNELGIPTKFYGGKTPKGWRDEEWSNYKIKTAKEFKNNEFCLMIATKSFGMGIDKPNVRYTMHFGIPNSIESFYQEAGRAGRDREHAECIIMISNDNKERTDKLLHPESSVEEVSEVMKNDRDWENDDDITRAMWFHINAFKGTKTELSDVNLILENIEDFSVNQKINIVISRDKRNSIEKGIHRLLILGVVSDYTIDYSSSEFHIQFNAISKDEIIDSYAKYVSGYNKGRVASEVGKLKSHADKNNKSFIKSATEILIEFIYDTIEKGRRRALREMLTLAETPFMDDNQGKDTDTLVRQRILRYLESTYSEEIEEVLNGKNAGLIEVRRLIEGHETKNGEVVGGLRSPKDAEEVRGQTARYLESTPDHPGLLFLRSLSEIFCRNTDQQVVIQNLIAGVEFSRSRYNIQEYEIDTLISWLIATIYDRNKVLCKEVIEILIVKFDDYDIVKSIFNSGIGDEFLFIPGQYLFKKISEDAVKIFNS